MEGSACRRTLVERRAVLSGERWRVITDQPTGITIRRAAALQCGLTEMGACAAVGAGVGSTIRLELGAELVTLGAGRPLSVPVCKGKTGPYHRAYHCHQPNPGVASPLVCVLCYALQTVTHTHEQRQSGGDALRSSM